LRTKALQNRLKQAMASTPQPCPVKIKMCASRREACEWLRVMIRSEAMHTVCEEACSV
jgi:lipoate synthase